MSNNKSLEEERNVEKNRTVKKLKINDVLLEDKVVKLFEKLEELYPEHKVFALDSLNPNLRERLTEYSKKIGYISLDYMLLAYGFEKIRGIEVKKIRSYVKHAPGCEPAVIKNEVDSILRRLEMYYPTKVVEKSIQSEHKKLSQSISGVYQWLGYINAGEFLTAYGYKSMIKYNDEGIGGGRHISVKPDEVIDELKKRCNGTPYSSSKELISANPDLKGKIKTISNKSKEVLGMTFNEYLKQVGIVGERSKVQVKKETSTISKRVLSVLKNKIKTNAHKVIVDEVLEKLEGLSVNLRNDSQIISITGTSRVDEILEIPYGVDQISTNAFAGQKDIKKVILSSTVQLVEKKAFENCINLREIVINNPECKVAPDAFWGCENYRININWSERIREFLKGIKEQERDGYESCINLMMSYFFGRDKMPESFWVGDDWKLAFSVGDILYQTNIQPLFSEYDYTEIDCILENFFGFDRVKGTTEYMHLENVVVSKKIKLDENGKEIVV